MDDGGADFIIFVTSNQGLCKYGLARCLRGHRPAGKMWRHEKGRDVERFKEELRGLFTFRVRTGGRFVDDDRHVFRLDGEPCQQVPDDLLKGVAIDDALALDCVSGRDTSSTERVVPVVGGRSLHAYHRPTAPAGRDDGRHVNPWSAFAGDSGLNTIPAEIEHDGLLGRIGAEWNIRGESDQHYAGCTQDGVGRSLGHGRLDGRNGILFVEKIVDVYLLGWSGQPGAWWIEVFASRSRQFMLLLRHRPVQGSAGGTETSVVSLSRSAAASHVPLQTPNALFEILHLAGRICGLQSSNATFLIADATLQALQSAAEGA